MKNGTILLKLGMLAALALCFISAHSQVSIALTTPLSFYFKPSDVLNLSVVSTQQISTDAFIEGRILNEKADIHISFKSVPFTLKPGVNLITPSSLHVDYVFNSTAQLMNIRSSSVLPVGRYLISISLIDKPGVEQLALYDFEQEVTPISPPFLISPANNSEIEFLYPLLVWSPSLPIIPGYPVTYDLKLVEVLQNQTPGDAIQKDFAVYEQKGIKPTSLQYPANAVKLEYGKQYAWQVFAKTTDYYIGQTEVFVFTPVKREEKKTTAPGTYGSLSKTLDAGYYSSTDKKVYFAYTEQYKNDVLNFKIVNSKSEDIRPDCSINVQKQPGDNHFMLDLSYCSNVSKGFYTLQVWNEKNELYQLKFKVE